MALAVPFPALLADDDPPREDPVWRAILAAPYMPLPAEIEAEALEAYDEAERFIRSGQRGKSPEEIQTLLAQMKAEQGDDDVGA